MKTTTTTKSNTNRADKLFGKKFADDPQAREIMSNVATWPHATTALTDRLGNYARIVRRKARWGKKRVTIVEARNHPAVEWLLDIIVPALCTRDSRPFRLLANAVETHKTNAFPASLITLTTCQLALELAGMAMPFNDVGEPNAEYELQRELGTPVVLPEIIRVPATESILRRKVEKRLVEEINPGTFTRILGRLGIRCRKDPHSGGRGRKVLHSRTRRQKPEG
jgi:hypothetical protein